MVNFFRRRSGRIKGEGGEIDPDEVLLDARNLPRFDVERFEGRIEKPISKTAIYVVGIIVALILTTFGARLYSLEIVHGRTYADQSENNRLRHQVIFSNRGTITDRNQVPLAWNEPPRDGAPFSFRSYAPIPGLAHIVGYARPPQADSQGTYHTPAYVGYAGVEKNFNSYLNGINGVRIIETDAHSAIRSESVIVPPSDGHPLSLSIDSTLTSRVNKAIADLAKRVGFRGGAGVIMDIETGELIALTNYPEYDVNVMALGKDYQKIDEFQKDARSPFLNRAVSGLYTPGSIVKPFIAAAALNEKIITPEKKILSTGSISIPNQYNPELPSVFKDWKAHGLVDMRDAIAVSSNVYFYTVGGGFEDQRGLGIDLISRYVRLFGFGEEVPGDLFSSEAGEVPDPQWKAVHFPDEPWRLGDTYNTSIGQYGFQVTPLQAVRAVAAIGNGGTLLSPTIVYNGNEFKSGTTTSLAFNEKDLKVIREGMRRGVLSGTAVALNVDGVVVAAKTGTAEIGTKKEFVNSLVVGFFPYEKPRYAFSLVMEHGPRANLYGAVVAMRDVIEWIRDNAPEYIKEKSIDNEKSAE